MVAATKGYTGAEIEKAVKDGIAASFYEGKSDLTAKNLLSAIAETKPISRVMADKVKKLRDRAKGSFRFASSSALKEANETSSKSTKKTNVTSSKKISIDNAISDIGNINKPTTGKSFSTKDLVDNRFSDL